MGFLKNAQRIISGRTPIIEIDARRNKNKKIHDYVDRYITKDGMGETFFTHKIPVRKIKKQLERYIDKARKTTSDTCPF